MRLIVLLALLVAICHAFDNNGDDDIVCGNRRTGFVRVFLNRDECPRPYYRIELPEGPIGPNGPVGDK